MCAPRSGGGNKTTSVLGVQAGEAEIPAMAAEVGRETRQGAESDEESDGCDRAQDCERVRVRNTTYFAARLSPDKVPLGP
jgi:hypothetical protein